MKVRVDIINNKNLINSYGAGGFTIDQKRYKGSIIILPSGPMEINTTDIHKALDLINKEIVKISDNLDILLVGSGEKLIDLSDDISAKLIELGINPEIMATSAACRTWNVLTSENRRIAALMMAI